MTLPFRSRISAARHPRLAALVASGIAVLLVGVAIIAADSVLPGTYGTLAVRVFAVGYILTLFGVAGYVALALGKRFPDS